MLEELVALGCRLADQQDALLAAADRDGCVPDDFYSTTNHRTLVRIGGQWVEVEQQRMDAVIVDRGRRARSAASCATCGPAIASSAASPASA